MNELAKRGMKATHSIYKLSTSNYISTKLLLKTYESTMKPTIMFSLEVWGHQMLIIHFDSNASKLFISPAQNVTTKKMCDKENAVIEEIEH